MKSVTFYILSQVTVSLTSKLYSDMHLCDCKTVFVMHQYTSMAKTNLLCNDWPHYKQYYVQIPLLLLCVDATVPVLHICFSQAEICL